LTPWLWGINGAASVCASVFAVAIALSASIPAAFWTGVGCYSIALIAYAWATRESSLRRPEFAYLRRHKPETPTYNRSDLGS
jgi:hypothetical protein